MLPLILFYLSFQVGSICGARFSDLDFNHTCDQNVHVSPSVALKAAGVANGVKAALLVLCTALMADPALSILDIDHPEAAVATSLTFTYNKLGVSLLVPWHVIIGAFTMFLGLALLVCYLGGAYLENLETKIKMEAEGEAIAEIVGNGHGEMLVDKAPTLRDVKTQSQTSYTVSLSKTQQRFTPLPDYAQVPEIHQRIS